MLAHLWPIHSFRRQWKISRNTLAAPRRGKVASPSHCYQIHVCLPHHCLHRLKQILTRYNTHALFTRTLRNLLKEGAG